MLTIFITMDHGCPLFKYSITIDQVFGRKLESRINYLKMDFFFFF